ncbi:hypothetical protein HPB48_008072 [Haemaphysalis longicornis]|uniref:Uncharacterized protein n=1 Tax=Haemaphysalis longicornis TaxID=44386 RepID=A0A9J6FZK1_HAELO|nr:hypothetical protein HPB48_008072 [Haemaphysalis longicornis]
MDVCPNHNDRTWRRCGSHNQPEGHQCTPKCSLCSGEHLTGDIMCHARYKIPYVVRRHQWERRQVEIEQRQSKTSGRSSSRETAPCLWHHSLSRYGGRRRSCTPSQSRTPDAAGARRRSCYKTRRNTSSSGRSWSEGVTSASTVKGGGQKKPQGKPVGNQTNDYTKTLKQENALLRVNMQKLVA